MNTRIGVVINLSIIDNVIGGIVLKKYTIVVVTINVTIVNRIMGGMIVKIYASR